MYRSRCQLSHNNPEKKQATRKTGGFLSGASHRELSAIETPPEEPRADALGKKRSPTPTETLITNTKRKEVSMTYEQTLNAIWDWMTAHKKAICYIAGIAGTLCFLMEAFDVIH